MRIFTTKDTMDRKVTLVRVGEIIRSEQNRPGSAKGQVTMAADFDRTPGDLADYV